MRYMHANECLFVLFYGFDIEENGILRAPSSAGVK